MDENNDGGNETPWQDTMPEAFRELPFIGKAENAEAAINAINNASQHMGNSIRIPGQDAGDEDMGKFYDSLMGKVPGLMKSPRSDDADGNAAIFRTLGQPEAAEGYKYDPPEGKSVPDDLDSIKEMAFRANMTQGQFQAFIGDILGAEWQHQDDMTLEQQKEAQKLVDEWGAAHTQNTTTVKNFLDAMKAPERITKAVESGTMQTAEMNWLLSLAKAVANPDQLQHQQQTHVDPNVLSPDDASNAISEMMNNREHAYWNAADPRHKDAVNRMVQLQHMANPEKGVDVKRLKVY